MKIVLDCNILVMCLSSKSPYHKIYQSLVNGKISLVVSVDIMMEYEEIIEKKYSNATSKALIALLSDLPNVQIVQPYYYWNLIKNDPDDNKYCDCAVVGKVDYVVTEDKHFNVLDKITFPPIKYLGIDEFCNLLYEI